MNLQFCIYLDLPNSNTIAEVIANPTLPTNIFFSFMKYSLSHTKKLNWDQSVHRIKSEKNRHLSKIEILWGSVLNNSFIQLTFWS